VAAPHRLPAAGSGLLTSTAEALAERLRSTARDAGLDALGFATAEPLSEARAAIEERRARGLAAGMQFTYRNPARSTEPDRIVAGARTLVVGARRYLRRAPQGDGKAVVPARVGRYSWVDHYRALREGLEAVSEVLRRAGWTARVVADDNALVDRAAAHRAGLGWFGRNTNLLLGDAGSWFVLGSVVTDAGLPPGSPVPDGCGPCRRCVHGCPTGALSPEGELDGRRCLAWLLQAPGSFPEEHRVASGDRLYGCDTCQEVCPINRRAERGDPPSAAEPASTPVVDALTVLAAGDEEALATWGRWWIAGRDPRWLRRNALLVIGNAAGPDDPDALTAVADALASPDPVLRGHAVWAAARLGHLDLVAPLAQDPDPDVRAEVVRAPHVPRRSDARAPDVPSFVRSRAPRT
jgi:epoxyqueuosine reductase